MRHFERFMRAIQGEYFGVYFVGILLIAVVLKLLGVVSW